MVETKRCHVEGCYGTVTFFTDGDYGDASCDTCGYFSSSAAPREATYGPDVVMVNGKPVLRKIKAEPAPVCACGSEFCPFGDCLPVEPTNVLGYEALNQGLEGEAA